MYVHEQSKHLQQCMLNMSFLYTEGSRIIQEATLATKYCKENVYCMFSTVHCFSAITFVIHNCHKKYEWDKCLNKICDTSDKPKKMHK